LTLAALLSSFFNRPREEDMQEKYKKKHRMTIFPERRLTQRDEIPTLLGSQMLVPVLAAKQIGQG
jgi:hypothetical protein